MWLSVVTRTSIVSTPSATSVATREGGCKRAHWQGSSHRYCRLHRSFCLCQHDSVRALARLTDIHAVAFLSPVHRPAAAPVSFPMKKDGSKSDIEAAAVRSSSRVYFQVRAQAVIYPVFPTQKPKR